MTKYLLRIDEITDSGLTTKIFSRETLNTDLAHVKEAVRKFD